MDFKTIFTSWSLKKKVIVALVICLIIIIAIGLYFLLKPVKHCGDYGCFQKSMSNCQTAVFVNDAPQATWKYTILGEENGQCAISVEMLQAKTGDAANSNLNGYSMTCSYPNGMTVYPGTDLSYCHGRLKEGLQTIIINKLHSVLVDNLINFKSGLNAAF